LNGNSFSGSADADLVQRAKGGDLNAFEALLSRYEQRVYSLAWRIVRQKEDAEDVAQQTFLSALEHLDGFRGEASFATWLLHIATHAALKVLRKRRGLDTIALNGMIDSRDSPASIPHPQFIADWRESPEQLVERKEVRHLLDDALVQLDLKHRLVFVLRDIEGLSIRETAEALGLTEANIKVRLLRARLQLRELLTRVLGDQARSLPPHHPDPTA
jgi:RNA polymerase sigma-70 factor (ECF subfamily)